MNIIRDELGTIVFHNDDAELTSNDLTTEFKEGYSRSSFLARYVEILENTEDNYNEKFDQWWNNMYKGGE